MLLSVNQIRVILGMPSDRTTSELREKCKQLEDIEKWARRLRSELCPVTKDDLAKVEHKIMSAISDYAAKQKAFNDRQSTAIDSVVASTEGLTADVAALNAKIDALQNSSGTVTPEDAGLINDLETQGDALATKVEAVSNALRALDSQTPPTPPPA